MPRLSRSLLPTVLALGAVAAAVAATMLLAGWSQATRPPGDGLPTGPVTIAGGEVHAYRLGLRSGEALHLEVDQLGVDVSLTLVGPDGETLRADSPNADHGSEVIAVVADATGVRRFMVESLSAEPGRYVVHVRARGPATETDTAWADAATAMAEGDAARVAGSWLKAADAYRRGAGTFATLGDDYRRGLALRRAATVLAAGGSGREALAASGEALRAFEGLDDRRMRVNVLLVQSSILHQLGELDRMRDLVHEALAEARRLGHLQGEAVALNDLGVLHERRWELPEALAYYRQALALHEKVAFDEGRTRTLLNIGRTYGLLGRRDAALDHLRRSLEIARTLRGRGLEADARVEIGWTRYWQDDASGSVTELTGALALARAGGHTVTEAVALDRRGHVLLSLGRPREATLDFLEALRLFRQSLGDADAAGTLVHLAAAQLVWDDPREALSYVAEAMRLFRAAGDRGGQAYGHLIAAQAERALDRPEVADERMQRAVGVLEDLRGAPDSDFHRATFLAELHRYFEFWVGLRAELDRDRPGEGWAERALEAAELVRGRSLLDGIEGTRAAAASPPGWSEEEGRLRGELATLAVRRQSLSNGVDGDRRAAVDRRQRELVEALRLVIDRRNPPAHPYRTASSSLADVRRELLAGGEAALFYQLGEAESRLWWITGDELELHRLAPRDELEEAARDAHRKLTAGFGGVGRRGVEAALAELSRLLLAPVAGDLSRVGTLRLVLDGALAYVPFAALPTPSADGYAVAGAEPLGARHPIVRAPSLAVALALRRRSTGHDRPLSVAVVADPVYGGSHPDLAALRWESLPPRPEEQLARLEGSATETKAITRMTGGTATVLTTFDASRERILAGALADHDVLHFAVHADIDARHPELAALVLSTHDRRGERIEPRLTAADVYRLDLDAELAVLAACATGLGTEVYGEGLLGLTQAFHHAGTRDVVVTLWPVLEGATTELMLHLHRALLVDGASPAAALRAAREALRGDPRYSSPHFWAAFVLDGDGG